MKNKYYSYESIIDFAKQQSDDDEIKRIDKEDRLFHDRGWEKYILFLANVLVDLSDILCMTGLSALDSYVLFKAVHPEEKNLRLLHSVYSEEVLFNDALRLSVDIVYAFEDRLIKLAREVSEVLEYHFREEGLQYHESIIPNSQYSHGSELIIVGNEFPSEKDRNVVLSEKRESTEEENSILRRYLLIRVNMHHGI